MRKIIAICLSVVLLMNSTIVLKAKEASKGAGYDEVYEEVMEEYENDPEYIQMLMNDEELAEDYIESIVNKRMLDGLECVTSQVGNGSVSTLSADTYGSTVYKYVKNIQQTTSTNCSATTLLQTMYGLGLAGNIYGSTDAAKINTLYNRYNDSSAPGARRENVVSNSLYVYEITMYLNSFLSSRTYQYRSGSSMTLTQFKTYIWDSLLYNRPVLLHAVTSPIAYYNNNSYEHYLSLDQYNKNNGTVRIVDCNYLNAYYGVHSVSVAQAYYSIHNAAGRYLISY